MRYWWPNQNQTYLPEIKGGYIWSPTRNSNGTRNQFYDNMREFKQVGVDELGMRGRHAVRQSRVRGEAVKTVISSQLFFSLPLIK